MERLPTVDEFAPTYNTPGAKDPLEAVEIYREYERKWASTQLGSHAISTRIEVPRGRIRTWQEGGRPDVVRGIETAREYGWLESPVDGEVFEALNRLVAGVFSGGSISVETFVPSFSAPDEVVDAQLRNDLDTLGIGARMAYSNSGSVEEVRPDEHGSVLGRVLVALGAPAGRKVGRVDRLPSYLYRHAEVTQYEFARVYVANRAVDIQDRDFMQIKEKRSGQYLDSLAALLRSTTGVKVWRGKGSVRFNDSALSVLGLE